VEIKVSKEGVTSIFMEGGQTQNKGEIRAKTRAITSGVSEIVKNEP